MLSTPLSYFLLFGTFFFFLMILRPPGSTLFPYTTLFRSRRAPPRPRFGSRGGLRRGRDGAGAPTRADPYDTVRGPADRHAGRVPRCGGNHGRSVRFRPVGRIGDPGPGRAPLRTATGIRSHSSRAGLGGRRSDRHGEGHVAALGSVSGWRGNPSPCPGARGVQRPHPRRLAGGRPHRDAGPGHVGPPRYLRADPGSAGIRGGGGDPPAP